MPHAVPAPELIAPPKRWPWLLTAAAVGAAAILVLFALHARQQAAEHAEAEATLLATELRQSVREITLFAGAVPQRELTTVLRPVIRSTAHAADARVDDLERALTRPDARVEQVRAQILRIRRLADSPQGPSAFAAQLSVASERAAATAEAIAATEHDHHEAAARQSIAGGALAVLFAMGIVALVLHRSQRVLLAAGRRQARQLQELADQDPLTGLHNRRRLGEDLARLSGAATDAEPVQVMICDLDGFKALNDSLGHEAGDELLVRFADHLVAATGDAGVVYRLGGDEFCVLSQPGRDVAGDVRLALAGRGDGPVRASAGLALWPRDAPTARDAMRLADERMYAAKAARRGRGHAA